MPCGLCGDIIPTEVTRCPACGAWSRRRDFRALAVGLFMLLGFNAFLSMGSAVSLMRMLPGLRHGTNTSYDAAATGTTLGTYNDVFIIAGAMSTLTGALFLAWLWRAHEQAEGPLRHRRAWTVGAWFLPFGNLWIPPRLMHDVWTSSGRYRMAERHAVGLVVLAWWGSLLGSIVLMALFPAAGTGTRADALLAVQIGVAANGLLALAATLCMAVVFQITRLQLRS
ncbi:DUF4328 domain-containing protein [Actinocorallia longicatena]|uniref:DUF4328 domain-containing protein n=1 Tax=Actinocorallia longicatena TaxID=111803 RepID=A0ABP6QMN0_9ACTN